MRQCGFSHARHVLNQQMAARQQAGHAVADLNRFAHNHRVKLNQQCSKLFFGIH